MGPAHIHVAIVGATAADPLTRRTAQAVGRGLARRGAVLVCGGLGGVMEAACKGAHDEGGATIGILPGDDRSDANPFVDVSVPTGLGEGRNALVVRAADAVVAVGGGYGTLSEIALALRAGKPVIGVRTWSVTFPGHPGDDPVERLEDPDEAAARAVVMAMAARRSGSGTTG